MFCTKLHGPMVYPAALFNAIRLYATGDCDATAHKGFYSKKNVPALSDAGIKHMLTSTPTPPSFSRNSAPAFIQGSATACTPARARHMAHAHEARGRRVELAARVHGSGAQEREDRQARDVWSSAQFDCGKEQHDPMGVASETSRRCLKFASNLDNRPRMSICMQGKA